MSDKEYHVYKVISVDESRPKQAYIFTIFRDTENHTIQLDEIFLFTMVDGVETKSKIDIQQVMDDMGKNIGGNVSQELAMAYTKDIEDDIPSSRDELEDMAANSFARAMIIAAEKAKEQIPPFNGTINVNDITRKKS